MSSSVPPVAARPLLPVSSDSLWDKAARTRDHIARFLEEEFARQGYTAWIGRSKPGVYPLSVSVASWIRRDTAERSATFDRSSLDITITVEPHLEKPLSYRVRLQRHDRLLDGTDWMLNEDDLREFVKGLLEGGRKPRFFRGRIPWPMAVLGWLLPFEPFVRRNRLIEAARPRHWTLPTALFGSGLLVALAAWPYAIDETTNAEGVVAALGLTMCLWAGAFWITSRRPALDAIPMQPTRTPRRELRIDEWHVSVPGAGNRFSEFRERIVRAIQAADPAIACNAEVHERLTPQGIEARERLVLSKGQATLHVHVYPYAEDVFVGWESHINYLRWSEGRIVASTIRNGTKVNYRDLDVSVHLPTDFDLIDIDMLAETTHRRLVQEIKQFLKEAEIEADLDFTIIRGDRSSSTLQRGGDESKPERTPRKMPVAYY